MSFKTQIEALALQGVRPCDIAKRVGCRTATVHDYIWKARSAGQPIPPFQRGLMKGCLVVTLEPALHHALIPHAERRGIEPRELVAELLHCLLHGGLVDAVLDDLDSEDPA